MRRDSNQQKIAIAVGIALSAGMFSIVPVAYGAPVGGTVVTTTTDSSGATVPSATITTSGTTTKIDGKITNNVIDWQDFSVAKGETVLFDNGYKTNNYMNIVSGANTSQIDGAIKGGKEVYIINPNGVIFGETASVDVGSLYASTRYVSSAAAVAAATAGDMTTVLADTSAGVATDVVNLGTINATKVVMEGQNVRFVNDSTKTNDGGTNVADYKTTGVTASSVTLKADTADGGYIHVGNRTGYAVTGYSSLALTDGNDAAAVEYYKLLGTDWQTVKTTINNAPAGAYMLSGNIDASGSDGGITSTFTGSFDGNYFEISSLKNASGLFASTKGAKIFNVGLVNSTISSEGYAGGIVASASASEDGLKNTTLRNVYNTASVSGGNDDKSGGLVGSANGVDIIQSYNTGEVNAGGGSAFIGYVDSGTNSITDSYNTGNVFNGLAGGLAESTSLTVDRVYTKARAFWGNVDGTTTHSNVLLEKINNLGVSSYEIFPASTTSIGKSPTDISSTAIATYIGSNPDNNMNWGSAISNTGGVTINKTTGEVTRPIWRIYEGQSTPVLTSQLKGITTVSYDYTHGSQSGVNYVTQTDSKGNSYKVGADLTATSPVTITNTDGTTSDGKLTYNGSYVNVDDDSLSFGGNADASLVSYSESGTTGVRNAKTKALFYSAQNGYDIVGGNVTMAKRQVTVEGTDLDFSHVYDGEKDVTKEFKTAFSASAGTGTAGGILTDDAAYVKVGYSSDFSAQFTDKKVENDKTIKLTGALTLETQNDSSGKAVSGAADILDNYVLADSSSDLSTTTVKGSITARPIYLIVTKPTDDRLNKTYDGTNAVNSTVSASDIFSLDGTTYDKGTQNHGYGKIKDDTVTLKVGTATPVYVDVDDAGTVTTDDAANAGTHKILFSGIELEGADAGNYKLQYSDTHNDVSNSQAFLDGVIRPRLLASDGFQVKTQTGVDTNNNPIYEIKAANKVYDGTSIYKVPDNAVLVANTAGTDSNTGVIAADTNNLWFKLSSDTTKKSYFMDSSNAETDMAAGDKAAVKVAYAVDVATKDGYSALKGNYTFDEATANGTASKTLNNYIPDVTGNGTISRRAITVAADGVTGIDRDYNGTANVEDAAYTEMGGQYLKYDANTAYKLLKDDSVSATATPPATDNADWNITAAYSDKNVARNADGSVADKTVNFTIAITGGDAVNYTLNGVNAENASVTLTGKGKIKPKTITPVFQAISKTYNGTNKINDSDATSVTLSTVGSVTGLTYKNDNNEDVTDDVRLAFSSGHSEADAYYVSADYNGNAGENLAVYYPHLALTGTDTVNYDLASTTGAGTGAINRRTILSNGFQVLNNGTAADGSKVYDGTDIYELPDGATLLADTTASGNTGVISRDQDNLWFTLSDNADSYFTNSAGTTRTSKAADTLRIAYQAGAVTRTGYEYLLNNYKIGANEASAVNLTADGTYSVFGNGHIDRRAINIDINNAANINKEYNADTDLVGAGDINIGGAYLNYTDGSAETSKLLADDSTATAAGISDTAAWGVSAAYDNKNVVRDADGNVIDNGKTVNFKISITGDDAANYTLNGVNAETTGAAPITLTGTGKITPKELTASFSPVSKIYNGTTRINDQDSSVTGNGTVIPLTGDTVTLNNNNYNADDAYYDTPDVGTDKTVYYPNLTLTGADSGNYKLSSTIGLGTGRIDTATVTLDNFVFNFAGVNRVYNGETAVADSAQGITADQFITGSYIDLGTGTFDFRSYIRNLNANYASKDVNDNTGGAGNVTYSFTLADMTIPNISITGDYQNYFANNPVTRSVGTITPKTVYATINNPVVTKTYNGAYGVQNYTAPLVSYSGLVGDSADASTAVYLDKNQGTDKLVQYNVAISDNSNYVIKYNSVEDAAHMATYRTAANGPVVTADDVITTIVTPNNVINPKDVRLTFADVTKQYDGTTSVQPVANQVALGSTTMSEVESGDTITLTGWNAVYNSPDVLTANTVSYRNITLSGNDNGNYNFIDANGKSLNANTVIDGNGTITPMALSGTYAFTLGDVTKEYDSTNAIKFTGTGTDGNEYYRDGSAAAIKNFITAPSLTINGASRQMGYELDMGNTGYNGTTVGEHPATFRVGISNTNYTFDSITVTDGTNTLTPTVENGVYYYNLTKNNAKITPRRVYVSLSENMPTITKIYDGDRTIDQDVSNMIIAREGDLLNDGTNVDNTAATINALYNSKDAGDRTVVYNVELTGNGAGNYEIHRLENFGTDADTVYSTLEGTGTITPATLTFNPEAIDKDYNGTADIILDADALKLTGVTLADGSTETVTLSAGALEKITGQYGKGGSEAAFSPDSNVSWNGDEYVNKDVYYTGLSDALDEMNKNDSTNSISKNYTIANTAYFEAAKAKGKIKPITITNAAVEHWTPITRTYNADDDLTTVYERGGTSNTPLSVNDILQLTLTITDENNNAVPVKDSDGNALTITYTAKGSYDDKNVGDNKTVNIAISGVDWQIADKDNNKNYVLADTVKNTLQGHTLSKDGNQITARQLSGSAANPTGNRKIYDGNKNADASNFVLDDDDRDVLQKDGLLNALTVTAEYNTKDASAEPNEVKNSKTINYTLMLNDTSGNYAIAATPAATAQGDIERRKVYVDGTNVTGIDKPYDGTTALPDVDYNAMGFALRTRDDSNKTGLVAGEEAIVLDASNAKGSYTSPNVNRAADGSVIARDITFTGFALDDSNAASGISKENYKLIDTDGSGVISPLSLSVSIAEAPRKTYDGTTTVKGTAAANANLVPSGLLTGDSANILIGSADYDDASAGTNKGYTYNITLGNGNYTLVQGSNAPDITVTGNGLKGQIKASDGTIDKRTITSTVNGIMTKVYDGTTAGTENAAASVSLSNVVSGDNVGLTAKAVYDNPNAGTAEDSDGLQNHKVTYKLNLSNPNYQLAEDTITGIGTISRKGLTIVATPVSINSGEAMPKFSGTVEGLVSGDENLASSFVFDTMPTVTNTSVEKPNPVYGWYRNQTSGNFGLNYTFDQDAANDTAFTVKYVDSGRNNPDTKITPTHNVYQQISKDKGSGFGDNAAAALEYVDKNGQVIARETIDSGEIHDGSVSLGNADDMTSQDTSLANIGIVGGDIVNVDGADAANMANIEVTDNGTTVNLEITSLSSGESGDKQAVAEITSVPAAADNSSAQIQNLDDRQDILEQLENKDKDEEKKDSEIAIESQNNQNDDEIELKIEGSGVKVA